MFVKQNPGKRTVTDNRGNFVLDALPPGRCTLAFRARKAQDTKTTSTTNVTVASSYSIKIEGTKRPVNQSSLTSDKLLAGVEVAVEVGSGAKVRGQVMAGALKKMVWIPKEPGSNIPGRWVEADSPEAKAAFRSNAYGMSPEGTRRMLDASGDNHQEGFPSGAGGGRP